VCTVDTSGNTVFYLNGVVVATASGVGTITGALATARFGSDHGPGYYDVSKPIHASLINGAFNAQQALEYSITLNNWLELGLTI